MSVLLFTNPYLTQQPPPSSTTTTSASQITSPSPDGTAEVSPSNASSDSSNSGSSTADSGSGAGAGGTGAQQPATKSRLSDRPSNASPNSVVSAQSQGQLLQKRPLDQDAARQSAIGLMESLRTDALIARIATPPDVMDLPQRFSDIAKDMPDPLPTSPFLKGAKEE